MKHLFSELIGNEKLKNTLGSELASGAHSHAYIIEGSDGSGRHTLAECIAKALMCHGNSDTFPCLTCKNCRNIKNHLCTDVYTLDRGDSATVKVEDVREMLSTLNYRPDDSDCKVYIINEADKMTPQAQNALLLSLEEPPEFVVFILIVNDSNSLLETVRSRAVTLKTEKFTSVFISDWLKGSPHGKNESEERIGYAAAVGNGSLGEALSALKGNSKKLETAQSASEFLKYLLSSSKSDSVMYANSLKLSKEELVSLIEYTELALGDILAVKNGSEQLCFFTSVDEALQLSGNIKMSKLYLLYESLIKAKSDINANVTPIVVMTTLAGSLK